MKYSKLFERKIILVLIVNIILFFALLLYFRWFDAMKLVDKGDIHLNNKEFYQAIHKYQEAQKRWPFLQNDKYVNKQIDTVYNLSTNPVVVFLNDRATQNAIDSFIDELKQIQGVTKVNFVSKEKALEIYREQTKNDPKLLELVTSGILPASIEISIADISTREKVIQLANSKQLVVDIVK